MGMTRIQILNAVLANGFDPASQLGDAKNWVDGRFAWLWDAEDWTFKQAVADITFTSGSQIAAGPTDVQSVIAVYGADGGRLRGIRDLRQFFNLYNTNLGDTGCPEAYTMVNGQVFVGPQGDGTTGKIVYLKSRPAFATDDATTGLPDGYDLALVHGGKAEGFKLTNIPLAANFDADFTAFVNALRNGYLDTVKETGQVQPSYRPGC